MKTTARRDLVVCLNCSSPARTSRNPSSVIEAPACYWLIQAERTGATGVSPVRTGKDVHSAMHWQRHWHANRQFSIEHPLRTVRIAGRLKQRFARRRSTTFPRSVAKRQTLSIGGVGRGRRRNFARSASAGPIPAPTRAASGLSSTSSLMDVPGATPVRQGGDVPFVHVPKARSLMLRKLVLPCVAVVSFLFAQPAESEACCWWLFGGHGCCQPVCCAPPPCCPQPACCTAAPACSPCGPGGCGTGNCGPGGCGISSIPGPLYSPNVAIRAPLLRTAAPRVVTASPTPRLSPPEPSPIVTSTAFPAAEATMLVR